MLNLNKLLETYNVKSLFYITRNKKINICYERFGMRIEIEKDIIEKNEPYRSVRIILKEFRKHPEYNESINNFIENLKNKNTTNNNYLPKTISINDKKKLIRKKLIKEGIIN